MTDEDILKQALERMKEARDVEQIHIDRGVSDLRFAAGEGHWPQAERDLREAEGKPTLTFNTCPQFVRRVTGQIRQMNPAIKVSAGDDEASEEVAEIYAGLIREMEYRCDAPSVYEGAAESAAQCGIGHFRIRSDYSDPMTFDQEIILERIWNPFSVFYDPRAKDPTRKDARYLFVVEEMSKAAFKDTYPKAILEDFSDGHKPAGLNHWISPDNVVIAEYFWLDHDEVTIYQLTDGTVTETPPEGAMILNKRKTQKPKVMWAKMTAREILEGPQRVAGKHLPVIAITGEEIHIGEEVYRSGVIRHGKDAAIAYNVMRTASIESAMLQPRAPYMVTPEQIAGLEDIWAAANRSNRPYLPYNPVTDAPAPMRVPPPIASSALVQEAQIAAEDLKRTTGIYDASLGARSNETSGVAIQSRQREAETATSVYADNMVKAITHAGNVIVGMIPEVYDAPRLVRTLGADENEKIVPINQMAQSQDGIVIQNNMKAGKYSVRVSVGRAYSTRREEAANGMMEFLQRIPGAAPLIADLVAQAQDWPGSDRMAERLKRSVPPQVLGDEEREQQVDPAAMQQQQAAAQQQALAAQAGIRKAVAEAEEATADAKRAQFEARKTEVELRMLLGQVNAAQPAPVPAMQGQPGQAPF